MDKWTVRTGRPSAAIDTLANTPLAHHSRLKPSSETPGSLPLNHEGGTPAILLTSPTTHAQSWRIRARTSRTKAPTTCARVGPIPSA